MRAALSHLFLPQESNNHRAKILHHKNLFVVLLCVTLFQAVLMYGEHKYPQVLGTSTDISPTQLLLLTNQQRKAEGVPLLTSNTKLASAADEKAKYMYQKDFWAHFGPDGTSPWDFINKAGYSYVYAGENLARGFTDSKSIVDAWMKSPTHRENMLSKNYSDVGFAVEDGTLLGEHTTLVVEMFGSPAPVVATDQIPIVPTSAPLQPITSVKSPVIHISPELTPKVVVVPTTLPKTAYAANKPAQTKEVNGVFNVKPLINSLFVTKSLAMMLLLIFIATFLIDAIIIERRHIVRYVGNHVDHLFYFGIIFVFVLLYGIGNGVIL